MPEMTREAKVKISPAGIYRHNSNPNFGDKVTPNTQYRITQENTILKKYLLQDELRRNIGWFYESELMILT